MLYDLIDRQHYTCIRFRLGTNVGRELFSVATINESGAIFYNEQQANF